MLRRSASQSSSDPLFHPTIRSSSNSSAPTTSTTSTQSPVPQRSNSETSTIAGSPVQSDSSVSFLFRGQSIEQVFEEAVNYGRLNSPSPKVTRSTRLYPSADCIKNIDRYDTLSKESTATNVRMPINCPNISRMLSRNEEEKQEIEPENSNLRGEFLSQTSFCHPTTPLSRSWGVRMASAAAEAVLEDGNECYDFRNGKSSTTITEPVRGTNHVNHLLAKKTQAFCTSKSPQSTTDFPSTITGNMPEAMVVSIFDNDHDTYHSSDLLLREEEAEGVIAELVGADFSLLHPTLPHNSINVVEFDERHVDTQTASGCFSSPVIEGIATNPANSLNSTTSLNTTNGGSTAITFAQHDYDNDNNDNTTEVTVIDSAPVRPPRYTSLSSSPVLNTTDPLWKHDAEAQVMIEDISVNEFSSEIRDGKPRARNSFLGRDLIDAVADMEAEVIDIQHDDDVHPSEHINDSEAELVGVVAVHEARDESFSIHEENETAFPISIVDSIYSQVQPLPPTERPRIAPLSSSLSWNDCLTNPFAQLDDLEGGQSCMQDLTRGTNINSTNSPEYVSAVDVAPHPVTINDVQGVINPSSMETITNEATRYSSHSPDDVASSGQRSDDLRRDTPPDNEVPDWLRPEYENVVPPLSFPFDSEVIPNASQTSHLSGLTTDSNSQRSLVINSVLARGTNHFLDTFFGSDSSIPRPYTINHPRQSTTSEDPSKHIVSRTLLPSTVTYNPVMNMWVVTLQTNQLALENNLTGEASKSLRAFTLSSEKRATCLAQSWTPPRMLPFSQNHTCHTCNSRFTVFKRACHCRNCGVCVCRSRDCSVQWPSKMIPETYNHKKESSVNICKTCDWLCHSFRLALLEGDFDKAVALYSTGNINVDSPFGNVKGELLYPVHAAVLGGCLDLLKWLVDERCSPIKSFHASLKSSSSKNLGTYTPIVTSKGRSLLGIAMETCNIPIMRYLVVEKGTSIAGEKDISRAMLTDSLNAALYRLPPQIADVSHSLPSRPPSSESNIASAPMENDAISDSSNYNEKLQNERTAIDEPTLNDDHGTERSDHGDECIICCDNMIDCVSNPCGHQTMCLSCASHFTRCPVCASDCTFIRVYKK